MVMNPCAIGDARNDKGLFESGLIKSIKSSIVILSAFTSLLSVFIFGILLIMFSFVNTNR